MEKIFFVFCLRWTQVSGAFRIGLWAVAMASIVLGLWLVKKPRQAIEAQIAFYRRINWKMEPLDLRREISNTRWMGATALACGAIVVWLMIKGM
jgi:hypothetical protein